MEQKHPIEGLIDGLAGAAAVARATTAPPQQVPSVGRVVHYVAYGTPGGEFPVGEHRAAMITEVDPPETVHAGEVDSDAINRELAARPRKVGLVVFNPTGQWFNRHVPYDETGKTGGTWHWPEYVPAR